MSLGKRIMSLRQSRGMTIAGFANAVGVTDQEVSEWESDLAYPDNEKVTQIAKFFGVPTSYFFQHSNTTTNEIATAKSTHSGKKNAIEEIDRDMLKQRNRGLIVGGIVSILFLVLGIIGALQNKQDTVATIFGGVVFSIFVFTFVSQLFYLGAITDLCLTGGKMFGDIGVIFSLDLDGILFLIGFKLVWFLIRLVIFLITLLFFALLAFLISPFTFIPATIRISKGIDSDSDL